MTAWMRTAAWLLVGMALAACAPRMAAQTADAGDARFAENALVMPDGARLPLHVWAARGNPGPKAVILGVHGFNDYGMGFDLPAQWFAAQHIRVYAYDQRGFGAAPHPGVWSSDTRMARDLGNAVALIQDRHPDTPVYVLGVSMGGAVTLAAAAQGHLPDVAGVVLSAPAVWARETMPFYQRWALWLGAHTVPWMTLTGAGLDRSPTDNTRVLRTLAMDPKVIGATRIDAMYGLTNLMDTALKAADALPEPALVLYGANDEIVPPGPTLRFWETLDGRNGVRLALYAEGWHMLLRDTQAFTVWHDIRRWMTEPDAPLPSGADRDALDRLRSLADDR
jgi:alpha-beta hydrolase superfamily lysophospholipase